MRPAPSRRVPGVLVEREVELAHLSALVDAAASGRGGSTILVGPAGVGKTALARALAEYAAARGVRVWASSAGQLETRVPFGVVRRLLDAPVRELGVERRDEHERGPARLALTQLWGHGTAAARAEEPPTQGDMLHSVGWLLAELVQDGPTLLVVDDSQWADEESLLFLGSLRERLTELPIAVLITARDESVELTPALSALFADRDALGLRLAALSGAGVEELLRDKWSRVPPGAASAVLEVTGGNAFLVHALADTLTAELDRLDPSRVRSVVPDSVVALMMARLTAMGPAEQQLARAVAVLDEATLPLAAALAELDLPVAAAAADRLRRAGLFADEGRLSFEHALLRSAVYAMLGPSTRDLRHRAAARLLGDDPAQTPARVAAHLLAAEGCGDRWAVQVLRTAAAEALALGAPQSAVVLLERAVDEPAPSDQLPQLLFELGVAQARMFAPDSVRTLSTALELTTDPVDRARCALALANAYSYGGFHARAAEILADTRTALAGSDHELELVVEAAWAAVAMLVPGQVRAVRHQLRARTELTGATVGERSVLTQQLTVAASTNQPASVIRRYARDVIGDWGTAERLPETGDWVWPRIFLAQIGDYARVRTLTDEGLAYAEERGSIAGVVTASFVRAFTELQAGDLVTAERYYRRMLTPGAVDLHQGGGLLVKTLAAGGLAQCLALRGCIDEATELLAAFPEDLPPEAPVNGAAMIGYGRAVARRAAGDYPGALAAAEQVARLGSTLAIDSPTWASWRPLAIDPLRVLGRLDEARELAAEQLDLSQRSEVPHLIGEALCLAGGVSADPDEAIALTEQGVRILSGTASRLRAGTGLLALGSMLRRSGRKSDARKHLRAAVQVLVECGAVPAAEFARDELAATGARRGSTDPRQLTPSERRVAELAAAGLGNPEIAARLHVSRKTVETHLSAVYRKLELSSREQLAAHWPNRSSGRRPAGQTLSESSG